MALPIQWDRALYENLGNLGDGPCAGSITDDNGRIHLDEENDNGIGTIYLCSNARICHGVGGVTSRTKKKPLDVVCLSSN